MPPGTAALTATNVRPTAGDPGVGRTGVGGSWASSGVSRSAGIADTRVAEGAGAGLDDRSGDRSEAGVLVVV